MIAHPVTTLREFIRALGLDPQDHIRAITVRVAVNEVATITIERVVTKEQTPGILAGLVELRHDAVIIDDVAA